MGCEMPDLNVTVFWADLWHMYNEVMICQGVVGKNGSLLFLGSYAAPPGPDWGWRIGIEPHDPDEFKIIM